MHFLTFALGLCTSSTVTLSRVFRVFSLRKSAFSSYISLFIFPIKDVIIKHVSRISRFSHSVSQRVRTVSYTIYSVEAITRKVNEEMILGDCCYGVLG